MQKSLTLRLLSTPPETITSATPLKQQERTGYLDSKDLTKFLVRKSHILTVPSSLALQIISGPALGLGHAELTNCLWPLIRFILVPVRKSKTPMVLSVDDVIIFLENKPRIKL